ncbi:MAG: hypothetical protein AB1449_08205 [Chloroflexota bacterium]
MATKVIERRLFEVDRRMELKLRLAAKKANQPARQDLMSLDFIPLPEREVVERLLDRVRRL